jgi:hypothetical protein
MTSTRWIVGRWEEEQDPWEDPTDFEEDDEYDYEDEDEDEYEEYEEEFAAEDEPRHSRRAGEWD